MCGIAGYSLTATSSVDRTLAVQALLAGIAARGADAVGYAWRAPERSLVVHKQRSGASALIARIEIGVDASEALVHVRAHTKGHPRIADNNHPIRHGRVIGVHNGTIENDDAIFASLGRQRHTPDTSVDSEAIFALAHVTRSEPKALEQLRGTLAAAWLDEREPGALHVVRGSGRPLWLGQASRAVFFASTRVGLMLLARTIERRLDVNKIEDGLALTLADGGVAARVAFAPDPVERRTRRPTATAPEEARRCRARLAQLAAARTTGSEQ